MIDNELWDSQSQLQDGSYFLHEHVLRDQNLHHELIHDLLMNDKVWHMRVNPERIETDSINEPRRCVHVRSEIGWFTEELSNVAHTGKRWLCTVPVTAELSWSRQC